MTAPEKENATQLLEKAVLRFIETGGQYFMAGGAIGFDTLAAQTVLTLRRQFPHIKLILVLPCLSQTRGWREKDIKAYEEVKAQADQVIYTSQEYTKGCMFKRNRHMVNNSSVCICYLTKDSGGTAYTVSYAKRQGLDVINLAAV